MPMGNAMESLRTIYNYYIKVHFSPVWSSIKPEEILDSEDHDTGRVQAEKRDFILVPARQHLQLVNGANSRAILKFHLMF